MFAVGAVLLAVSPVSGAQAPTSDQSRLDAGRTEQQTRDRSSAQVRNSDIYGYQLMTERERSEFRDRIRAANSEQEREQIRSEHREQMQARARERGVTLPGFAYGAGPRQGGGTGGGAGKGGK
jgi:hypothetical protein